MPLLAQVDCQSFDTGEFALGHTLTEQQKQLLLSQDQHINGAKSSACSADGKSCSVQASDGTVYGWGQDNVINRKALTFSEKASLPKALAGWSPNITYEYSVKVSKATCVPFTVEHSDSDLLSSNDYLKSQGQVTQFKQDYVTTIFGSATKQEPLVIEMSLAQKK